MSEVAVTSELPKDWVSVPLKDAVQIILGQSPASSTYNFEKIGLPFFQGKTEFGDIYPTVRKWCGEPKKVAEKEDVLVSVRAPVGPTNLAPYECAIGRGLAALRPLGGSDSRYFLYLIRRYQNELAALGTGTTFEAISGDTLKNFIVPIAPLEQQKRIVAKIEELFSHIDAGIEALNKAKQLLKQYRQSVLKAAVTGELTKEWREARIKDDAQGSANVAGGRAPGATKLEPASQLLERILQERRQKWEEQQLEQFKAKGKMPKNDKWKGKYKEPFRIDPNELVIADGWVLASWDQISNWVTYGFTRPMPHIEEGIPIVTGKNVIDSRIRLDNTHKTPRDDFNSLSEKDRPKAGDLLITKDGTIGRASIVPENLEFCINQSVAVIWLRSCPINRKYLLALVESDLIQKPIIEKARGVAIQHLSITDFAKLPVPIPSLEEQEEIIVELNEKLEGIARLEKSLEQQLKKSERSKQSILDSAFSGGLH